MTRALGKTQMSMKEASPEFQTPPVGGVNELMIIPIRDDKFVLSLQINRRYFPIWMRFCDLCYAHDSDERLLKDARSYE